MIFVLLGLLFAILYPPHWGHLRLEYPFVAALVLVALQRGGIASLTRGIRGELVLLFLMTLSGMLSIIVFNASSSSFSWRDMMSIIRYPAYAVLLMSVVSYPFSERHKQSLYYFLGFSAILCSVISIIQYFNILGLNQTFVSLYRNIEQDGYYYTFVLGLGNRRVIGTAGNPNSWGFALSLIGILVMARIVFMRHLLWMPHLILVMASLLMAGSRTAMIGFIVGSGVMMVAGAMYGRIRGASIVTAMLALMVLPGVFYIYSQQTVDAADRYSTNQIGSLLKRFEVWSATIDEYSEDFLIGRGPNKSARRVGFVDAKSFHVRDNIFVSVFAQFGILGLALLIGFFIVQWRKLWRAAKETAASDQFWILGMLGGFVSWFLFNITADAFFALHPTHLFLAIYGVTLSIARASPGAVGVEPLAPPVVTDSLGSEVIDPTAVSIRGLGTASSTHEAFRS